MASISIGKDRRVLLYIVNPEGVRRKIALGRVTRKQAGSTRLRVEELLEARMLGTPLTPHLAEWLRDLPERLRLQLVRAGIVDPPPASLTLEALITKFLERRTVKPGTMATYRQCTESLLTVLGRDTPISKITAAEAEHWKAHIATKGRLRKGVGSPLAAATVAKRVNIAKAIFSRARRWKLIGSSPFEDIRSGSQANPRRAHYISVEDTRKLLDACTSVQWRALIGIARYAGLRCPSEIRELKWGDLDWDRKSLTVRSPKTEASPVHAVRAVPICRKLQPILYELHQAAEKGVDEMVPQAHRAHTNIFQGLRKIIARAGLKPWPRLLQNLRASCAMDWANERPLHQTSKWLGHSPTVATKHYLQPQDLHFVAVTGTGAWCTEEASQPPKVAEEEGVRTIDAVDSAV